MLESGVSHEFIFTIIVYTILSVLRISEYLLLGKQFYSFLFQQKEIIVNDFLKKHSSRYWYMPMFSAVLVPYFLLGFVIPGLGIYQEVVHAERLAICYRHYHEIYIVYCAINFLRYMSAFTVRIMMIYSTLFLSKLWFPEHEAPLHTSIGLHKSDGVEASASQGSTESSNSNSEVAVVPNFTDVQTAASTIDSSVIFNEVLDDWKTVSSDYQTRSQEYVKIGKKVQVVQELFQTWFIVPWVIYFVACSLKTYNILRPWNADEDGDTPPSNIPQIYYLLYNINQLITLIIPFLCAKKMNTYHQKYYKIMRDSQLEKFDGNPSRLSFARQLMVEHDSRCDFVPRIMGTSIKMPVGSPLYVIFLLAGLFLSVTKSLL